MTNKEDEWELADIPDLLEEIINLNQRLIDEQSVARDNLRLCQRGWYMKETYRDKEWLRLSKNIEIADERKSAYQKLLTEFAKEQIKKNEFQQPTS